MTRVSTNIAMGAFLGVLIVGATTSAQTNATPDRIRMTVQEAAISMDDLNYVTIFDSPVTQELNKSDSPVFGSNAQVPVGTYRVVRLTVTEMTWSVDSWGITQPPPCGDNSVNTTGLLGGISTAQPLQLYFKNPDLGGNTIAYYQANPPISGYAGDALHPFVLVSPVQVLKDTVTPVNLIIGATNTLTCGTLSIYNRTDGSLLRTVGGPATMLNGPAGVYVDTTVGVDEIGVINSGNNSVTVYNRTAAGDVAPFRHPLIGPATRLNQPAAIYVDTVNDEMGVANQGNDSVTVYSRTAIDNANPLRVITGGHTGISGPDGIYGDAVNNEILVTNSGNNSLTIYSRTAFEDALPYRTIQGDLTGLSHPCGVYVDTVNNEIGVANTDTNSVTIYRRNNVSAGPDNVNSMVGVSKGYADPSIPVRDPGTFFTQTFTLDFAETAFSPDITITLATTTTLAQLRDMINNNPGNQSSQAKPRVTATIMNTGSATTPYRLVIFSNFVEPANNVTVRGTLLTELRDFWIRGNVSPVRTISGPELSSPCGLYLDTTNKEIAVANSGNNSITIYDRDSLVLKRAISGSGTGLGSPRGLYLDLDHDEIGVVHNGQQVVMAQLPSIFPSGTNGDASSSELAGDYNVVLYGVDVKGVDSDGNPIPLIFTERGTATFDASTAPWPQFILKLDTQIFFPGCVTGADVDVAQSGFYGVNKDGSFYAFIPGINGSLQGAFLPDGTTFVGSMVDNSKKMMLVYGVKTTGSFSSYLTANGTLTGGGTNYAFATYRRSALGYLSGIGMAATDVSYFERMSGDANFVGGAGVLIYDQDSVDLRVTSPQSYFSHPGGLLENPSDNLFGAVTTDGATLIYANVCPTGVGFGIGLRQRPAGTFSSSAIKGTYFVAAFGDQYESNRQTNSHRSMAASLNFNGAGSVEITQIVNAAGSISIDKASFTYQVNSRVIPTQGNTRLNIDVVDIFDRTTSPYASALIGKNGKSLSFFPSLSPGNTPNPTRLLGLAVFQHP